MSPDWWSQRPRNPNARPGRLTWFPSTAWRPISGWISWGFLVADSNTGNDLAEGSLTLYVHDPVTGEALSDPVSLAVECSGLETDWGGDAMNIMFLSDPGNKNDTPAGTRLDLAALWDRALDANEVAALSMIS